MSINVALSPAEFAMCRALATYRSVVNRIVGIKDMKLEDQNGLVLDEDGMIGEFAFCKHFNIFLDVVPIPRSGGYDCIYLNKRVDVKSTRLSNGRLTCKLKPNESVDAYVLAVIEEPIVKLVGWASASKLVSPDNIKTLGVTEMYALDQDQLNPWKST